MKQLTIYVLDEHEGATVEEKTYQCIADAFDESGYEQVEESKWSDNLAMAKALYRVVSGTLSAGTTERPEEWEVVIEGDDDDMQEYENALEELE